MNKQKHLFTSPKASKVCDLLLEYLRYSNDEIELHVNDYAVYYIGKLSKNRENELRMYALGIYDTMCAYGIRK